jgi:zinc protease
MRLVIDAGAATELPELACVAALTVQALAEGTTERDGAALAEAFERFGASLSPFANWDDLDLATTVVKESAPPVLRLLAEVVRKPAFPEHEVTRLRDERLAELLELRAEPRGLADELFEALLYTQGSRFAYPEAGRADTVSSLGPVQVRQFYKTRFKPSAATLIVAGDVNEGEVLAQVKEVFGGWAGDPLPSPALDVGPATESRTIHLICRPGAPQTEIRVGHVGVARRTEDYFSVVLMNAILGGVFNSRINLNLREKHGFTYGASSVFDWRRAPGPFVVSTAVATEVTGPAIREILGELERMRSTMPDGDEVSLVTSYLEGVFPIRFETTEAIASALAALTTFQLPDDYYDTYRSHIRAVTAESIAQAARRHLHTDRLQIVAVGDPDRIGEQLGSLALGPVISRDTLGSPLGSTNAPS